MLEEELLYGGFDRLKELQAVAGFGKIKAKKYGDGILRIVEKCK